jgi:hypothetical protein
VSSLPLEVDNTEINERLITACKPLIAIVALATMSITGKITGAPNISEIQTLAAGLIGGIAGYGVGRVKSNGGN